MTRGTDDFPLREASCPYCERQVLVYEDPPRCPLCACPLERDRLDPGAWRHP